MGSDIVVVTSVVGIGLVAMFVVGKGHGVVHTIRVVSAAMGGEGEGDRLGTEALRGLSLGNDAAEINRLSSGVIWLVVSHRSDRFISNVVGSAHDALYTFEVLQNVDRLKIFETDAISTSASGITWNRCRCSVSVQCKVRNGASVRVLERVSSTKLVYFCERVESCSHSRTNFGS